jgi:alkanesulfonate monooxygenase SsuD/methylene tetrahydromethanopterin reductase-like flavin-dependent oxidoreductase (luciferase family)
VGADGAHFAFRPVPVVPRPRRPPPLWVAATSADTVDLAAARGVPLLLGMHASDDEKADLLARYAEVAGRHGHDPAAVGHASAHLAYVSDTDSRAVARLRGPLLDLLRGTLAYERVVGPTGAARDLTAYAEHLLAIHPVGSPERCRRVLTASAAATGVRHQLLLMEAAGDPQATVDNIARFAAQVLAPHDSPADRPGTTVP